MLQALFEDSLRHPLGVLHSAAVWESPSGQLVTLRINQATPRSPHDEFALSAARARAEAVVTTGKILRDEAQLTHDLMGPAQRVKALREWEAALEKSGPRLSLVLTSGRGLDFDRPLLRDRPTAPIIFTSLEAAAQLRTPGEAAGVEVVGDGKPGIRRAVEFLQAERGFRRILIEAGPSASRPLYDSPVMVDELLLSVFRGKRLPEGVAGPPFLQGEAIAAAFPYCSRPFTVEESSGTWCFQRWRRG